MRKLVLCTCVLLLTVPALLTADPVDPYNNGPVSIDTPGNGEASVQQVLNQFYGPGSVNAMSGQQSSGEWMVGSSGQMGLTMVAEYAAFANSNVFGIWSGTDSSNLTMVNIFDGSASAGCGATIGFMSGSMTIGSSGCASGVNVGTFSGINPDAFGFFLKGPGTGSGWDGAFFTANSLNGGNQQAISYMGPGGETSIFFEDLHMGGTSDYNDQIVSVDPMTSVPEASTLSLLGTGLLGLFGFIGLRRKFCGTL